MGVMQECTTDPFLLRRIDDKLKRAARAHIVPELPANVGEKALARAKQLDALADTLRAATVGKKALERARQLDAKTDVVRGLASNQDRHP